jgi:hypothetical protein
MKIAQWRQNKLQKLDLAGRVQAGDGLILKVAGPRDIILLSICGIQL